MKRNRFSPHDKGQAQSYIGLVLIGVFLIQSAQGASHSQTGRIHGRVLEDRTGNPVILATVRLEDQETGNLVQEVLTDNDGNYGFDNVLANRTHNLVVSLPPVFRDQRLVINAQADQVTEVPTLYLEKGSPLPLPPILISPPPIFFGFNSALLNNDEKGLLDEIAIKMNQTPRAVLVIDGHRDSAERVGISLTRANNGRDYLLNEKGLDPARMTVRNFGDTCPHESGFSTLKRRVEFWILPSDSIIDRLEAEKRCGGDATPRVITDERPADSIDPRPRRRPRVKQNMRGKKGGRAAS